MSHRPLVGLVEGPLLPMPPEHGRPRGRHAVPPRGPRALSAPRARRQTPPRPAGLYGAPTLSALNRWAKDSAGDAPLQNWKSLYLSAEDGGRSYLISPRFLTTDAVPARVVAYAPHRPTKQHDTAQLCFSHAFVSGLGIEDSSAPFEEFIIGNLSESAGPLPAVSAAAPPMANTQACIRRSASPPRAWSSAQPTRRFWRDSGGPAWCRWPGTEGATPATWRY